jgi:hypothetical protein
MPLISPSLADAEQLLLGAIDRLAHVRGVVKTDRGDLARGADQVSQHGLALDDARVMKSVDRCGREVDEAGQVGRAAHLVKRLVPLEGLADGDDVDGLAPLVELQDGFVDLAVRLTVEILRPERVRHLDHRVAVDEQRTEDGLLGLDRLRRKAVY